jgi:hypothetical protein
VVVAAVLIPPELVVVVAAVLIPPELMWSIDLMALVYARYMLCYIFYLVAIVLATILGLTEYAFAYKIVYFFKIAIIVFMTGSVL